MQVQKKDVQEAILAAAAYEFAAHGYKHASMRAIAGRAGITPGNIYAYFTSKEQLFTAVVAPVAAQAEALCRLEFPAGSEISRLICCRAASPLVLQAIVTEVIHIFLAHRNEFFILLRGSEGSPFAGCKDVIIETAARRIRDYLLTSCSGEIDADLLAHAWATAVIEGLCVILLDAPEEETALTAMVSEYLCRLFSSEVSMA